MLAVLEPDVDLDFDFTLKPCCELRIIEHDADHGRCAQEAFAIVRFKSHRCARDGKGVLVCEEDLGHLACGGLGCAECGAEEALFVVSVVNL